VPDANSARRLAAARERAQCLAELSQKLGGSLSLDDILSLLASRLNRLVPHDSMAVYLRKNNLLVPEFVSGENLRLFSSLRIPLGEGLSGWVAQNHRPILNGNPSVEPGYPNSPTPYSTLRSALAVPIEASAGVVAVLALHRAAEDAFSRDDLQTVEAIVVGLGVVIERAATPRTAAAAVGLS
jgi:GAF domain-containing protein